MTSRGRRRLESGRGGGWQEGVVWRCRVPLRISFGGGGTDVAPYVDQFGGAVLNATIDKYAYASLRVVPDEGIHVQSLDYDLRRRYDFNDVLPLNGELDLVKAVMNRFREGRGDAPDGKGLEFFFHSDAPPGSGLGSSSTMCAALLGLVRFWCVAPMTDYELAEAAVYVERNDLGIAGGRQDQYAAVFGGVNFIEFGERTTVVNPLRISPDIVDELQYNCLLFYVGNTRQSDGIIRQQQDGVRRCQAARVDAMHETKALAVEMKNVLLQGDLRRFGELLDAGWQAKKRMADNITNPAIDRLYSAAMGAGAFGGKVTGAGGGGHMLFMCDYRRRHELVEAMTQRGASLVSFSFDPHGLRAWKTCA